MRGVLRAKEGVIKGIWNDVEAMKVEIE